jgi:hypothetical protein
VAIGGKVRVQLNLQRLKAAKITAKPINDTDKENI